MSYQPAVSGLDLDRNDVMTWLLRRLGAAWGKGRRKDIRVLDDGSVELVLKYERLGDMLTVLTELDALKAMVREDRGASQ
jgi:hypothetical protein